MESTRRTWSRLGTRRGRCQRDSTASIVWKRCSAKEFTTIRFMVCKSTPTLKHFAEKHFLPFVRATFQARPKTRLYYENGAKNLLAFDKLAGERLDRITTDLVAGYVVRRQRAGLKGSSINRELQALRRSFASRKSGGTSTQFFPPSR